jgi:hypothetical protein
MEKSVTFYGACANEMIPLINRSFFYNAKEGGLVRIEDDTTRPYRAFIDIFREHKYKLLSSNQSILPYLYS